jgi:hypothetical protein
MSDGIRPELAAFAQRMEGRLKENEKRGDWHAYNFYYLVTCIAANLGAMVRAYEVKSPEVVLRSAVDTANYCLMVADLFGELSIRRK